MRFLIIFIFLISNSFASDVPNIKNIVINKDLKKYNDIAFLDINKKTIKLEDFEGKLILLNFWATWCVPCKKEMPSLDALKINPDLNNLVIFPINMGKDSLIKSKKFYKDLDIKNLDIFFDNTKTLAKDFNLRGIPTTILFNKNGKEFARILGSIDFEDIEFINWVKKYN
tara:strand:+ start:7354 stop:7863 length:510 start_codon:yes stop_codon:yes gene_type:complete